MNQKTFFDIFPTPKFLDIPYSGLSMSDTAIRCIQLGKNRSGMYVKKFVEKPIPPGTVVSGYINNQEEIVQILEAIKKECNITYIKASLPEEKAYLFTTHIPRVSPKEVRSTIEFTIEENVPLPSSELTFNYGVPDAASREDRLNVVVSAVPTKIIDRYVETIQKANIPLLSLEIESQAMARALVPHNTNDTRLIVHFGAEKVGLYVAHRRIVHFTSTIVGVGSSQEDLSSLSQEIKRLYIYWHTLKENVGIPEKQISQIVVCGERVTDAIVSYLSAQHSTVATMGNVWTNVCDITTHIPPISFTDSLRYVAAVGLALPSHILIS